MVCDTAADMRHALVSNSVIAILVIKKKFYIKEEKVLPGGTASIGIDGAGRLDCDSRRALGPVRTIRGVYMTQLNRLQHLAAFLARNEWSF